MTQVTQTTRQDLPEWAQPQGKSLLEYMLEMAYNKPDGGYWKPSTDPNAEGPDKSVFDTSGGLKDYSGPLENYLTPKTGLEKSGDTYALNNIWQQQPINDASKQWMLDTLGGQGTDLANMYDQYLTGGPIAGASRAGLMNSLTGNTSQLGEQALQDALFGKTTNSATNSAYNTLGPQRDIATDASMQNFTGANAGTARKTAMDTMLGKYLYPESNPYLDATAKAAGRSMTDSYRYATAPGIDAAFARAGSFGGSAHQQTKDMEQFKLGQNLSDLENQIYEGNYQNERSNQLNTAQQQDAAANASLEAERGRQYGTQNQLLQQQLQATLAQQQGYNSLLDNSLTRGTQVAEGQLGRGVQAQSLMPSLQAAGYVPADIMRTIGAGDRQMTDANNQVDYNNALTQYQWPYQLMNILNAQLASSTGGQGVTTTTGANPNSTSGAAQGVGGAAAGIGLLSTLGQTLFGKGSAAGGTPAGIFT